MSMQVEKEKKTVQLRFMQRFFFISLFLKSYPSFIFQKGYMFFFAVENVALCY